MSAWNLMDEEDNPLVQCMQWKYWDICICTIVQKGLSVCLSRNNQTCAKWSLFYILFIFIYSSFFFSFFFSSFFFLLFFFLLFFFLSLKQCVAVMAKLIKEFFLTEEHLIFRVFVFDKDCRSPEGIRRQIEWIYWERLSGDICSRVEETLFVHAGLWRVQARVHSFTDTCAIPSQWVAAGVLASYW